MKEEKLQLKMREPQTLFMKVGAQIIEHLSKGIYSDPAYAIKELINNSFDADATEVIIRAKPEFDTFSVTDNGDGMNYKEFNDKFLWISRSDRRDEGDFSKTLKRPIIGKFGIGFVAVSQLCNKITVISSKKGDDFKFVAEIDFSKFKKTTYRKKEFYDLAEVKLTNEPEEKNKHYTIVLLSKLTNEFKNHLKDKDRREAGIKLYDFEGLKFEKIIEDLIEKGLDLSKNIGRYWQFMLEIANVCPVEYLDLGPIQIKDIKNWSKKELDKLSTIDEIEKYTKRLKFSVDFDGLHLKKPFLLPNDEKISKKDDDYNIYTFKEKINFKDGSFLKFNGYFYNQRKKISPRQWIGLIIRIKNTAVGPPDPDFLDYPYPEKMYLPWTFGEIFVEEGLEDAMNINRSSFTITHLHYKALQKYVHNKLHTEIFTKCRERWTKRRKEKEKEEERSRKNKIKNYLKTTFKQDFRITVSKKPSKIPVFINLKKSKLIIYDSHPIFKVKKTRRAALENVIILFEVASLKSKGDPEKMRDYFLDYLKRGRVWWAQ